MRSGAGRYLLGAAVLASALLWWWSSPTDRHAENDGQVQAGGPDSTPVAKQPDLAPLSQPARLERSLPSREAEPRIRREGDVVVRSTCDGRPLPFLALSVTSHGEPRFELLTSAT